MTNQEFAEAFLKDVERRINDPSSAPQHRDFLIKMRPALHILAMSNPAELVKRYKEFFNVEFDVDSD